jgi:hypothetical protein
MKGRTLKISIVMTTFKDVLLYFIFSKFPSGRNVGKRCSNLHETVETETLILMREQSFRQNK